MTHEPIRLVAMDVDDTLLTEDLVIPQLVIDAVAKAQEAGVLVTLATGRMFASVRPFAEQLQLTMPLITYNGAFVCGLDGTVFSHRFVPKETVVELAQFAQEEDVCLNLYVDDQMYVAEDGEPVRYYANISKLEPNIVGDLVAFAEKLPDDSGSTKVLLVADANEIPVYMERLGPRFEGRVAMFRSKPRFVEMVAHGVSKGEALAELAAAHGIPISQVMAIGDSFNDLEMLEMAGIGVAMGNASDAVKRVADVVVASNREAGVAEAIYRYVLDRSA